MIFANTTESPSEGILGASEGTLKDLEKDLPKEEKIPALKPFISSLDPKWRAIWKINGSETFKIEFVQLSSVVNGFKGSGIHV